MEREWVEWGGGEMPIDADTLVFVRFRQKNRETLKAKKAHRYYWHHSPNCDGGDIIAYRGVLPAICDGATDTQGAASKQSFNTKPASPPVSYPPLER